MTRRLRDLVAADRYSRWQLWSRAPSAVTGRSHSAFFSSLTMPARILSRRCSVSMTKALRANRPRLFRKLPRQVFLPISPIGVGKVKVRIGGIRIRKEVELENLDRRFRLLCGFPEMAGLFLCLGFAQVVGGYDVHLYFRKTTAPGDLSPGFYPLPCDLGRAAGVSIWLRMAA